MKVMIARQGGDKNPGHSVGGDQENRGTRPVQAKSK
jgi:hypothetical protein